MFKRLCIAMVCLGITTATFASGAAADPKGIPITLTCDNGRTLEAVFEGNGNLTPGHVVGSTEVYVIQSLDSTSVFIPTGETAEPEHIVASKSNLHGELVTCSFDVTVVRPNGVFHGFGTSVAMITPAS